MEINLHGKERKIQTKMDLPNTLTDALVALDGAQKDLAAFNSLNDEHTALLAQLQELNALMTQQTASLNEERSTRAQLLVEIEALRLKEVEASAKANVIVANLGVDPVEIQAEQGFASRSSEDLWKEYNSLPIAERNDFYAKHKASLSIRR